MQLRLFLILIHGQMKDNGCVDINRIRGLTVMKLYGNFTQKALSNSLHTSNRQT